MPGLGGIASFLDSWVDAQNPNDKDRIFQEMKLAVELGKGVEDIRGARQTREVIGAEETQREKLRPVEFERAEADLTSVEETTRRENERLKSELIKAQQDLLLGRQKVAAGQRQEVATQRYRMREGEYPEETELRVGGMEFQEKERGLEARKEKRVVESEADAEALKNEVIAATQRAMQDQHAPSEQVRLALEKSKKELDIMDAEIMKSLKGTSSDPLEKQKWLDKQYDALSELAVKIATIRAMPTMEVAQRVFANDRAIIPFIQGLAGDTRTGVALLESVYNQRKARLDMWAGIDFEQVVKLERKLVTQRDDSGNIITRTNPATGNQEAVYIEELNPVIDWSLVDMDDFEAFIQRNPEAHGATRVRDKIQEAAEINIRNRQAAAGPPLDVDMVPTEPPQPATPAPQPPPLPTPAETPTPTEWGSWQPSDSLIEHLNELR